MSYTLDNYSRDIFDFFKEKNYGPDFINTLVTANLVMYLLTDDGFDKVNLETSSIVEEKIKDTDILNFIYENILDSEKLDCQNELFEKFLSLENHNLYKDFILDTVYTKIPNYMGAKLGFFTTPNSILKLSAKLLDLKSTDEICDMYCGQGSFIKEAVSISPNSKFTGIEINYSSVMIAKIVAYLLKANIDIKNADVLEINPTPLYDKIFCDAPIMYLKDIKKNLESNMTTMRADLIVSANSQNSTWQLGFLPFEFLKDNGKMLTLIPYGFLTTDIAWSYRKFLTCKNENRYGFGSIETIIELPEGMHSFTNSKFCLVVMSKKINESIRFIRASSLSTKERKNILTDEAINKILECLNNDTENSISVSLDEIAMNDYSLNPNTYLDNDLIQGETIKLEEVATIKRGAQLISSDIDKLISKKPTNIKYLMLGNIQDGLVDDKLQSLKEVPEKFKNSVITKPTLLIQKNGFPLKLAIPKVNNGESILVSGNIFIIELNESKINPYYLKAFFESDMGQKMLSSISIGTAIQTISISPLLNLRIPYFSIDKQNNIAKKYIEQADKLKRAKKMVETEKRLLIEVCNFLK